LEDIRWLRNRVAHHEPILTSTGSLYAGHQRRISLEQLAGCGDWIAIARALVHQPKLVLADEPTAALDKHTGREVVDLMSVLAHEHGTTIILVTHDNRILDVADRILNMEDGRLI
jgi:ABC-type lipoprotein export system ATPase subunit